MALCCMRVSPVSREGGKRLGPMEFAALLTFGLWVVHLAVHAQDITEFNPTVLAIATAVEGSEANTVGTRLPRAAATEGGSHVASDAVTTAALCPTSTFEWPAGSCYCWYKRDTAGAQEGPGPNYFDPANAVFGSDGALELKVATVNGRRACGEVFMDRSLGLGDYIFTVDTDISKMDKTLVGSPFLYANDANEIDVVEFSQWNDPTLVNTQFVVQPYSAAGATYRFNTIGGNTTYRMRWSGTSTPSQIRFEAWSPSGALVHAWSGAGGNNFVPGAEAVHINHWIHQEAGVANPLPAGFVSSSFRVWCFKFCPLNDPNCPAMGTRPSCGGPGTVTPSPPPSPRPPPPPSPPPPPPPAAACPINAFNWPLNSPYCWQKRSSGGVLQGPGNNYFTPNNVLLTSDGGVQLNVTRSADGKYNCAEVFMTSRLGYGDYIWTVETSPNALHPALAGATFVYANDSAYLNVEFSKWGSTSTTATTYGFSVAGSPAGGYSQRLTGSSYTHRLRWAGSSSRSLITFETWTSAGALSKSWVPTAGNNFATGSELPRINLWVYAPSTITSTNPLSSINSVLKVRCFKFCPVGSSTCTPLNSRPTCP